MSSLPESISETRFPGFSSAMKENTRSRDGSSLIPWAGVTRQTFSQDLMQYKTLTRPRFNLKFVLQFDRGNHTTSFSIWEYPFRSSKKNIFGEANIASLRFYTNFTREAAFKRLYSGARLTDMTGRVAVGVGEIHRSAQEHFHIKFTASSRRCNRLSFLFTPLASAHTVP